jgi:hypothetical protein
MHHVNFAALLVDLREATNGREKNDTLFYRDENISTLNDVFDIVDASIEPEFVEDFF